MASLWQLGELPDGPSAAGPLPEAVDVAVIGGGITGLTTALRLSDAGARVAVLEARRIGEGNTGNSTGNLYATLSSGLAGLRRKWSDDEVQRVVAARADGVRAIAAIVERLELACDFRDCSVHFCVGAGQEGQLHQLDAELQAASAAGLNASLLDELLDWPLPVQRQLRIDRQAQFNPLAYVQGLAQALRGSGVAVHEQCRVLEIDAAAGSVVTTAGTLRAAQIVVATHTPLGINLIQAEMEPYRELGVALPWPSAPLPAGIVWMQGEGRSLRSYQQDGRSWLVVVGEKHKTGHTTAEASHARLAEYAARHFDVAADQPTDQTWQWSAQQYKPADGLPYIGRSAHQNVYIATGFAADGLTWGSVAGTLIADEIAGRKHHLSDLVSPRRFTPVKSAQVWIAENKNVAAGLLKAALPGQAERNVAELAPGEGRVMHHAGERVAAYRDLDGTLSLLSPICPHMKCMVEWNNADRSWDCPCHGSRFDTRGEVIEGPALEGLQMREGSDASRTESASDDRRPLR